MRIIRCDHCGQEITKNHFNDYIEVHTKRFHSDPNAYPNENEFQLCNDCARELLDWIAHKNIMVSAGEDTRPGRMIEHKYGMRLRGFSPGCQPMRGFIRREDDPAGQFYDVLVYNRHLTWQEKQNYALCFICSVMRGDD